MTTYAVAAAVDVTAVVRDVTRTVAQLDVLGLRQVSLVLNVIQFCRVTQNPVRIKRYIKFYLRNEYSTSRMQQSVTTNNSNMYILIFILYNAKHYMIVLSAWPACAHLAG